MYSFFKSIISSGNIFDKELINFIDNSDIDPNKKVALHISIIVNFFKNSSSIIIYTNKVDTNITYNMVTLKKGEYTYDISNNIIYDSNDPLIISLNNRYIFDRKRSTYTDYLNMFKHVSGMNDFFFKSSNFENYKIEKEKIFYNDYENHDKSKFLLVDNNRIVEKNKYINVGNTDWYNTGYIERRFIDSEIKRIKLNNSYILMRNYSGFYGRYFEYVICKLLDTEENIALFNRVHNKSFYMPSFMSFDPYKDIVNHRRKLKIKNIIL